MRLPKALLLLPPVAACMFAAARLIWPADENTQPEAVQASISEDPPDVVVNGGSDVFRRAFWRHPAPMDRILQAELREWKDAGEVSRWSWHLRFIPGPKLRQDLLDGRIFPFREIGQEDLETRLAACSRPAWAPTTVVTPVSMLAGNFLLLQENGQVWYAEDHGGGFAKPAE